MVPHEMSLKENEAFYNRKFYLYKRHICDKREKIASTQLYA